jgi:hypothetical protein
LNDRPSSNEADVVIAFYEGTHKMLPGVGTTVRSTVVPTRDGVIIINPIDFSPQQRTEIRSMGGVVAVVEANRFHSAYAAASRKWFPTAELWGAPGLPEKCPTVTFNKILHQDQWPYSRDLQTIFIRGAGKPSESVFFHPETKTMIVTDLVFNMRKTVGLLAPLTYRLLGINNRFTVAPFFAKMVEDQRLTREAFNEILRLDFDRLVMSHGEIVTKDARSLLAAALRMRKLI